MMSNRWDGVIFIGCGHQCRKARPFDVDIQPSASSTLYNERQEPVTVIIVFTGMTPEGWRCILWKGTQRYHSRTFGGNAVRQRQFSGAHKVRLYLYL